MKSSTGTSARQGLHICNLAIASAMGMGMGHGCLGRRGERHRAGHDLAAKVCSPCHVFDELPGPSFGEIAKGEGATDAPTSILHSRRLTRRSLDAIGIFDQTPRRLLRPEARRRAVDTRQRLGTEERVIPTTS